MCKNNCFFAVFLLGLMSNMAYADLASTKYVQDYVTAKTPTGDLASLDVVDTNHIADSAVTTGKIKNLNVTTAKIADGAVTTGKILDGTIKNADVAVDAEIAQSKISGLTSALDAKVNIAQGTGNKGKGLIVNADGNLELANVVTTLTADNTFATQGSYVHDIKVEDGEIKPKSVAFDTVINATTGTGSNAPRTSAVKSYIDQFVVTPSSRLSYITGYTTSADGATITPQLQQFDTEIKDFAGNEDKYNAPTTTAVKDYVDTEVGNVVTTIEGLDLGLVGSAGSYIKTVQQVDGKVTAVSEQFDTVIDDTTGGKDENGKPKTNAPTTYAVKTYVDAQIDGVIDGVDDEISSVNSEVAAVKSALNLTGSGSSLTYSLPVATTTTKGAVIVGGNIGVNEQGTISVATANGSTLGVVKSGTNTSISNGAVNVATATPSTLGVVRVGQIPSGSATATNYATIWVE